MKQVQDKSLLWKFALAIPGLSLGLVSTSTDSAAQTEPGQSEIKLKYFDYRDSQQSGVGRMRVHSPIVWGRVAVAEKTEVEGSFQIDDMAGASPYYLDAISGATGIGIEDYRRWVDLKVTQYFDDFSVTLGGSNSTEEDYESKSFNIGGSFWTEDKNTTFSFGFSPNFDRVTSSNNPFFLDRRRTFHYFTGVTQVINPISIIQSNVEYTHDEGYLSDPYKYFDNRQAARDELAWLTRYNIYIEPANASLHSDYRLYFDSWGMVSHTFELQWYQPIAETWMIRPLLRFYSQSSADFYSQVTPPIDDSIFSADQRLGAFGSLTTGIKISKEVGAGFSVEALIEFYEQHGGWKLGGNGDYISPLYGRFFGFGVSKKF